MTEKGAVTDLTWDIGNALVDRTVTELKATGTQWVRCNVPWNAIEKDGKGIYNMAYVYGIDYAVQKLMAAGIKVLMPIADGVPYWASADPYKHPGNWNRYWRPSNFTDYADFCAWVVDRWRYYVRHFEVWNEPNHSHFWPSGISASEYAAMLSLAYGRMKEAAQPWTVTVLGGSTSPAPHQMLNDRNFLAALKSYNPPFDVLSVHSYPWGNPTNCWDAPDSICGITALHDIYPTKDIWVTELGWPTGTTYTEAQQAQYLTTAYNYFAGKPYVKNVLWYSFRDTTTTHGLLRRDFTAKPALAAYKAA